MGHGCSCGGIRKRYKLCDYEKQRSSPGKQAPQITYTTFEQREDEQAKPKADGTKRKKAVLVKQSIDIGAFMEDVYLPAMEHFDYHAGTNTMLNLCSDGFQLPEGDAEIRQDFAMALGQQYENAPQGADHWCPETVTIETAISESRAPGVCADAALRDEHNFYFSAHSDKGAEVVDRNRESLLARLRSEKRLSDKGTAWVNTDGASSSYWCSKTGALSSRRAKRQRVNIDLARCCPGHGKVQLRGVDGAHAVVKSFGREVMAMEDNGDSDAEDVKPRMEEANTLADELHRICTEYKSEGRQGGKHTKRQRLAKMESRYFDLYDASHVQEAAGALHSVAYQTTDPSTPEERRRKLPHSTWRAFHNLRLDVAAELKDDEGMLRRWPCRHPCCVAQLAKPSFTARYAVNPHCVLAPIAQGLNEWRRVKFKRAASEDAAEPEESDESALVEALHQQALSVVPPAWGTVDANGDPDAAGTDEDGRFYVVKFTSTAYELEAPEASDWGELPAGTLVLNAMHTNLLIPGKLVYGPNPESVTVPAEQVLHVFYEMAPYQLPKTAKWAHISGEVVQLSTVDYDTSMAELRDR